MSSSRRDRSYSPREDRSDRRDRDRSRERDSRAHGEGSHRSRHRSDNDQRRADRHDRDSRRDESREYAGGDKPRSREWRDRREDSPEGSRMGAARSHRDHRDDRRDRRDREDRHHGDSGRSGRRKDYGSAGDDDEDLLDLRAIGVAEITSDDFFIKSAEFKYWLRKERDRYLDEMSSESARRYFRKFVRRWNDGALQRRYYSPAASSSSNTAYKWSFKGEKASRSGGTSRRGSLSPQRHRGGSRDPRRDEHTASQMSQPRQPDSSPPQATPADPDSDSDSDSDIVGPTLPTASSSTIIAGPTVPTHSDRRLAIEDQREAERQARKSKYKSDRRDAYEKADELVPKQVGKEGKMAEKRASNAANKEMRDKEPGGLEVDEGTLMGSEGSSFQAALRARDAAQDRRADRRAMDLADQRAAMEERMAERRQKEAASMEMLRAMAKQRFG